MPSREYVARVVEIVKVTDGDTFWVRVDVGYRANVLINVRLLDYDTPELRSGSSYEKRQGGFAAQVTQDFLRLTNVGSLWIRTEKDPDSFGRWLGEVWREVGEEKQYLGETLLASGLAARWPERWRDVYDNTTPA